MQMKSMHFGSEALQQREAACVFTAAGRRGQQTFGCREQTVCFMSLISKSREGLIKSGSPSLADEFFIKTICSL